MSSIVSLCAAAGLGCLLISCASPAPPSLPSARAPERARLRDELTEVKIHQAITGPLTAETEKDWEGAFWAMGLLRYRSDATTAAIARGFEEFERRGTEFRRSLLEVVYTLYPREFRDGMAHALVTSDDPKLFAMAALHLVRLGEEDDRQLVMRELDRRFASRAGHPIIRCLRWDLGGGDLTMPPAGYPLQELFGHDFGGGGAVLFSVQRAQRDHPGLALVRGRGGRFVRAADGSLFHVRHFARAASNLPGYLTNGNTPEGVFSFQGFAPATNPFIGPTETIQLVMPWEAPPSVYFHGARPDAAEWNEELYRGLLPPLWRRNFPILQAYLAGEAGRSEIIAHGTAIDPSYYAGEVYYPLTPSQGCMTAYEEWSAVTGERVLSDQQRLVDVMKEAGFDGGWCVVVEMEGGPGPVLPAELEDAVAAAEAALPARRGIR